MRRTRAAAAILLLLLSGCGPKKVYERADLEKRLKDATPEQVRSLLGTPDEVSRSPAGGVPDVGVWWTYRGRTKGTDGALDDRVCVFFSHRDRVYNVVFHEKPGRY